MATVCKKHRSRTCTTCTDSPRFVGAKELAAQAAKAAKARVREAVPQPPKMIGKVKCPTCGGMVPVRHTRNWREKKVCTDCFAVAK